MSLDLPTRLATDWLTWGLIFACGVVVEIVAARHPGVPAGGGLAATGCLALWYRVRTRPGRVLRTASLAGDGSWRLQFQDGHGVPARLIPGTRVLGRSIVLRWSVDRRVHTVWLTPWDLSDARLRRLTVRLRSVRHGRQASPGRGPGDP